MPIMKSILEQNYIKCKSSIDWIITFVPFIVIVGISILFFAYPEISQKTLAKLRHLWVDTLGSYYLLMGLCTFIFSIYFAFSKYGDIILGNRINEKKYSFFSWACMMFTCGLAADILFYSFAEWILYASNPHIAELGSLQEWAGVFSIFHWGVIPWSFYLVLAVAFGFMIHVRKRKRYRFSEACRPILGEKVNGAAGRIIDLFAVFALVAGTATTFGIATPLLAAIISTLFPLGIGNKELTIIIIVITCCLYTYALLHGFKGIRILAKLCMYLFFGLLLYVLVFGGQAIYIIETGVESIGRFVQYFICLATYTDPLRKTCFPQDWTIYYWAYWMVWCIAAPFFIGNISEGRSIKEVILGGYLFGTGSTIAGFVILGNYSLKQQVEGVADYVGQYAVTGDLYTIVLKIIEGIPGSTMVMFWVMLSMVAFYATSFDSIAYTASCYSYRSLNRGESPHKGIQLLWCVLLIVFPIALVYSDSSMANLQSVSIITAFPIGILILMIIYSFYKDAGAYMAEREKKWL